ncbi:hypothetical protein HYX12_00100 [Candidatus Woesearchaeota archaeon]|nr:hypothetical protein [Candidatus Woesearchaeota archaeon]
MESIRWRQKLEEEGYEWIEKMPAFRPAGIPHPYEEREKREVDSLWPAYHALEEALLYYTNDRQNPLTEKQYLEVTKFIIDHHPKILWDWGNWFKKFNKVVSERKIPVDETVQEYMDQHDNLHFRYIARKFFTWIGRSPEKAEQHAAGVRKVVGLNIQNDEISIEIGKQPKAGKIIDADLVYRTFTRNVEYH